MNKPVKFAVNAYEIALMERAVSKEVRESQSDLLLLRCLSNLSTPKYRSPKKTKEWAMALDRIEQAIREVATGQVPTDPDEKREMQLLKDDISKLKIVLERHRQWLSTTIQELKDELVHNSHYEDPIARLKPYHRWTCALITRLKKATKRGKREAKPERHGNAVEQLPKTS